MSKIPREVAEQEVTTWLDKKKILQSNRDQYKDHIETLVDAISEGYLILDTEGSEAKEGVLAKDASYQFRQKLMFPLGESKSITELTYLFRMNIKHLNTYMQGNKSNDSLGFITTYICALTRQNRAIIDEMDTGDRKIANSIAVFFM